MIQRLPSLEYFFEIIFSTAYYMSFFHYGIMENVRNSLS